MGNRIQWADYAKGICIILVVMWHSTKGVELAVGQEGWLHSVVYFARPFRMPDFFLISGLFLARVIGRDWRTYLDRKVVHFAYFYVLWLTINVLFKGPFIAAEDGWPAVLHTYARGFIDPFGQLWFIYLLPIFFVVARVLRPVPWPLVWGAAAALQVMAPAWGDTTPEYFAMYFVYFYTGYIAAPRIFAFAESVQAQPRAAAVALLAWAVVNGYMVAEHYYEAPIVSLALGFAGALAVVTVAALLAQSGAFTALRYCGRQSLAIYCAFFIPMATARIVLLKWLPDASPGWIALAVTLCGLVGALVIYWLVRDTRLRFLFERPAAFQLAPGKRVGLRLAD